MKHLLTFLLLSPFLVLAQVSDDFTDGNFTQNPAWTGNETLFIVNDDYLLQTSDIQEGEAILTTNNSLAVNCEWRFWIKQSFSPSANNYSRVYLVADNQDLLNAQNAYFLQFGESGSEDAIELFKQNNSEIVSVCRGTNGLISSSFEVGMKITRDENGVWKIYADPLGGENYQLETQATDLGVLSTQYFGVFCKYTSSNSTKFYFDNFYVGEIIVDTQAPEIEIVSVVDKNTLNITFNEVVDKISAETTNNYLVDNAIGNPVSAKILETNSKIVQLIFEKNFENGQENKISIGGIQDLNENIMTDFNGSFIYYEAEEFDVLINEIMADPSPSVGLPEFEYLELYNTLDNPINLEGWKLIIGSSENVFIDVVIEANSYLIIGKSEASFLLQSFGKFYGFDSFSLTNSGQDLILQSKEEKTISMLSYSIDWYNDATKQEGGWSLEQINPDNICSGSENWTASNDIRGGSPGIVNSVDSELQIDLRLSKFEMMDAKNLRLIFNQKLDELSAIEKSTFYVDNEIGEPTSAYFSTLHPEQIILSFENYFEESKIYEITIKKALRNCRGIELNNDTTFKFGLSEMAENMDIIINEVLFNPLNNGVDFVEIYNASFKVIDLAMLKIGYVRITPPNSPDTSYYSISNEQKLILPGDYLCLSSSPDKVIEQYFTSNKYGFLKVHPFPTLNNDKGSVLLISNNNVLVDAFDYTEEMQFPLLVYVKGVSLERASFFESTKSVSNWHSASESVGFATPAYQNSQFIGENIIEDEIIVEPEIFSPDNDGYNDLLSINYNFDKPGYMMSINIFNSNGYPVRELTNNEYLGTSGSLFWDGIQDDNTKAAIGIYIIFIKVFDLDGNIKKYKKTAVLAGKL